MHDDRPTFDIAEDGDLVMLSDSSNPVVTPPSRIAARFFHTSNSRRRSSAASSRRNSLSSTHSHSHHSHHSFRGPPGAHTRNVAQHLRRASIIETRKARLADRAAHAEQVRLRAALAKAAPRISNTEERAVAAQQARERYLAQVASACADEVKRAKRIAEDTKKKHEAEHRKLRGDMEERLAEAERRRAEYQRNLRRARAPSAPSASSPPRVDEKSQSSTLPTIDKAVMRIQRAWRIQAKRRTLAEFLEVGLSIEGVRDMTFEDVGALLSQEKVLTSTAKTLCLCGLQEADAGDTAGVRTFLSAYLILGHPAQVLSHDGDQEKDLISKSRDLIIAFQTLLSTLKFSNHYAPSLPILQSATESCNAFTTAFTAWKAHDSSVLVGTMIAQYVELDLIWQRVKDDTEEVVKAEYSLGIRENQILLLAKIKRLAGPGQAMVLIRDAIRKSRRTKSSKPAGSVEPRATSSPHQSIAPSTAQPVRPATEPPNVAATVTGLPRSSRHADELTKVTSSLPDNRILVHELAINKNYRIDAPLIIHAPARQKASRAVYDQMRADIQDGLDAQWIVAMAEYIRERLLRFLKTGSQLHTLVKEALDPVIIQRECSIGSFSYQRFFSFLLTVFPKLCAPFRDAELRALAEGLGADEDVIDLLSRFIDFLDLMSIDYANFLLQQSKPKLIDEAAGYEQRRFADDLEQHRISLESTERWWSDARERLVAETRRRDPEGVDHPANRPSWPKIYAQALTDLTITFPMSPDNQQDDEAWPATLQLDRPRILRLRADTLRIVLIGSILLTAKNLLKRDVRAQWTTEATRMWDALSQESESDSDPPSSTALLSIIESSHALPAPTRTSLLSFITRLLAQMPPGPTTTTTTRVPTLTDPVPKLLLNRLRVHVLARLSAASSGERVRVASTASEGLARSGLPEFVGRVGEVVDVLGKIGEVDRAAHARWYDEIAERAERE